MSTSRGFPSTRSGLERLGANNLAAGTGGGGGGRGLRAKEDEEKQDEEKNTREVLA